MNPNVDATLEPVEQLLDLTGRVAIVTGAAKGIGEGIARRLHQAGARVVIADVDDAREERVSELNGSRAASAIGFQLDVTREQDAEDLVRHTVEEFGEVDILVNNAGIYPLTPFVEMDAATFRRVVDVNLMGVFNCSKAVVPQMIKQGHGGRIINITSIAALGPTVPGTAPYDSSKHAAWGFTKNVALELAQYGILVNAIAPGGVLTPGSSGISGAGREAFEEKIPLHRMGVPDDIARKALFFASDLSSYMTGTQLVVDGGQLLG
jgi:NAD(P)-dependent dehydrogenase (short-subunit alcohol dehydrogenase family)